MEPSQLNWEQAHIIIERDTSGDVQGGKRRPGTGSICLNSWNNIFYKLHKGGVVKVNDTKTISGDVRLMCCYLFMDLLCGLSVTEGHGGQIFQDRHLHRAVATVEERHQGARVHRSIHNLGTNTCREERGGEEKRREERRGVNNSCLLRTK